MYKKYLKFGILLVQNLQYLIFESLAEGEIIGIYITILIDSSLATESGQVYKALISSTSHSLVDC